MFQSTPSGGKATVIAIHIKEDGYVSIHAFRGEGDVNSFGSIPKYSAFQSTPSGGKATYASATSTPSSRSFNPRLPGGRRHR